MDQMLEVAKVAVLPNLKLWEPQRSYEKRLGAIMAKENRELLESSFIDLSHSPSHQLQLLE